MAALLGSSVSGGERLAKVGSSSKNSSRDCVILPLVMWSKPILRSFMMSMTTIDHQLAVKRLKMRSSMEMLNLISFFLGQ